MPELETKYFGTIPFESDAVIEFPAGLPAFERCRQFVAIRFPERDPLVFLQSLEDSGLCFVALPVQALMCDYRLDLSPEDRVLLGLQRGRRPRIGQDILCLAVLSIHESGPTANLMAPVAVSVANRKAVQAINQHPGYSHRHALVQELALCS